MPELTVRTGSQPCRNGASLEWSTSRFGKAGHQTARAPALDMEVQVEPEVYEPLQVALEVAPLAMVGEARGGAPAPRRQLAERRHVPQAKRAVDRPKLVVSIFTSRTLSRR